MDTLKKNLVIIHGAGPKHYRTLNDGSGDWQLKLVEEFSKNFKVLTPQMLSPTKPSYDDWKILLDKYLARLKGEVHLVGHSLGGSFLVKYLAREKVSHKIAGLYLVSAPFNTIKGFETPSDFSKILGIKNKFLYHCMDDVEVPYAHSILFREHLHAKLKTFEGRGHYFKKAEFPEIIKDIRDSLQLSIILTQNPRP